MLNNEVTLIGRIITWNKNNMCNNKKSIKLKMEIDNDDNTNKREFAVVYIYDDGNISKYLRRDMLIGFSGHVECNYGQRLICDVLTLSN